MAATLLQKVTIAAIATGAVILQYFFIRRRRIQKRLLKRQRPSSSEKRRSPGIIAAVGNTPLIRIESLSRETGCEILAKAEFLNPGGSIKDRIAVKIIQQALDSRELQPGGTVFEGSAGSTAISLATIAPALGCKCHVVIPDDAALEKSQILEALGANVERVRPVSITHRDHFVNVARRRAVEAREFAVTHHNSERVTDNDLANVSPSQYLPEDCKGGYFVDQFENLANFQAHYESTGPEIWEQTGGKIDAFVCAAGTGGTIAGVSQFLQEKDEKVRCFLVDPPGSGLYNKVTRGVMYTREEAEGRRLRNPFDTITEGVGINRLTKNFMMAERLSGAFRCTDLEAVEMSRFLLRNDGLFVGSSSAINCVGAVHVARLLGPGHIIVTILCDSGMRHLSKFYCPKYLLQQGLTPSAKGLEFLNPN